MAQVFRLMVQRRITAKEAGVLCYIAQTILHTHRAMAYQQKLDAEGAAKAAEEEERKNMPPKLTWNLPRSPADLGFLAAQGPRGCPTRLP